MAGSGRDFNSLDIFGAFCTWGVHVQSPMHVVGSCLYELTALFFLLSSFPNHPFCISTCGITLNFLQNDSSKCIQFIQAAYSHSTFLFFLLFMTSVGDGRWPRNTEEISIDIKCSLKESKKMFLYSWRFPWLRKAMKQSLDQKAIRQAPFLSSNTGLLNKRPEIFVADLDSQVKGHRYEVHRWLEPASSGVFLLIPWDNQPTSPLFSTY